MNWEGYSENASAALDAAQAAAEELHHGFIGTEHILIGLLRAPGTAGECLRKCGADESMVFPYADTLVGGGRHIFTDSRGFAPPGQNAYWSLRCMKQKHMQAAQSARNISFLPFCARRTALHHAFSIPSGWTGRC